ncbi:MAG: four helix bundle protein [bacterium]|jgi:four helix bundle protein
MAIIKKFEDVIAWQKARTLCTKLHKLLLKEKLRRDFSYRDQLWRSAISVMSNIAEGFARSSSKEFVHFLFIASGSAAEVQSLLYVGKDAGYVSDDEFRELYDLANEVSLLIGGLRSYLKQRTQPARPLGN